MNEENTSTIETVTGHRPLTVIRMHAVTDHAQAFLQRRTDRSLKAIGVRWARRRYAVLS